MRQQKWKTVLSVSVGLVLIQGPVALGAGPGFDCGRAENEVEKLVCGDPQLARLDLEMTRLYRLALDDPSLDREKMKYLRASQRGWIKGRDEAWKVQDGKRYVADLYLLRIAEIRRQYPAARQDGGAGISSGPTAYDCETVPVQAYFIQGEPPGAVIYLGEFPYVVGLVLSASGARYAGEYADGKVEFWTKGDEALVTTPAYGQLRCAQRVQ